MGISRGDTSPISPAEAKTHPRINELIDLLARFEGFVAKPYKDAAGVLTVGYGETNPELIAKAVDLGKGFTEEVARRWLKKRAIEDYWKRVYEFDVREGLNLDFDQYVALTSFTYNVGGWQYDGLDANLKSKRPLTSMQAAVKKFRESPKKERDYIALYLGLADGVLKYRHGGDKVLLGLIHRRFTEAALLLKRVTQV